MGVFRRIGRFIAVLLIPVVMVLVLNSSANRHNHQVRGYLYTHAHPFKSEGTGIPVQNHDHTLLELIILNLLSDLEVILTAVFLVLFIRNNIKEIKPEEFRQFIRVDRLSILIPRAPPGFL